jgi:hypothetical protein
MKKPRPSTTGAAAVFASLVVAFLAAPRSAAADPPQHKVRQPATQVRLVGCVQREIDYRRAHHSGKGGPLATGAGLGDEYILVNASSLAPGEYAPAPINCSSGATTGEAYELTGGHEKSAKPFLGHWVEVTGTMKKARVVVGTSGTGAPRPTAGVDPLQQDLRLFEIEVSSVRDAVMAPIAAAPPEPAPEPPIAANEPPPAAAPEPAPEPEPVATSGREELPKTASPMPLVGLFGLLFIAAATAVRSFRAVSGRL